MKCHIVIEKLDGFRTGEMEPSERESTAAHLAVCENCSQALAELQTIADHIGILRTSAPEAVLERILSDSGDRYEQVETDLGRMWMGYNRRGITMVDPGSQPARAFEDIYEKRIGRRPHRTAVPAAYANAVRRAAEGTAVSNPPVDLSALSSFEQKVLLALRNIPRGEVRPYVWLAREVGRPAAVRAVGNTMARNPVPLLLPCHRVVPAGGGIGNYAFGSALKRKLLVKEGAPVEEIEMLGRDGVRYIGCKSTGIYCFPTCHDARRMKPQNRVPFRNAAEAGAAGYRPCLHCCP